MRKQLSAPVSLMAVVIGFALVYYAFHSNGWNWDGEATLAYVYRGMLYQSRVLVIVGIIMSAWGLGSFFNAVLLARKSRDQVPPSA
jgi:uncharacterized membrane protein